MALKLTKKHLDEWAQIRNSDQLINPKTGVKIQRDKPTFLEIERQYSKYIERQTHTRDTKQHTILPEQSYEDALRHVMEHLSIQGDHRTAAKIGSINTSLYHDMKAKAIKNNRERILSADIIRSIVNHSRTYGPVGKKDGYGENTTIKFDDNAITKITNIFNTKFTEFYDDVIGPASRRIKNKTRKSIAPDYFIAKVKQYMTFVNNYKSTRHIQFWMIKSMNRGLNDAFLHFYERLENEPIERLLQNNVFHAIYRHYDIRDDDMVLFGCFAHALLYTLMIASITLAFEKHNRTFIHTYRKTHVDIDEGLVVDDNSNFNTLNERLGQHFIIQYDNIYNKEYYEEWDPLAVYTKRRRNSSRQRSSKSN